MRIKCITEQNPSLGDIVFIIKQSQTALPSNAIECHSLLPGIVFDTYEEYGQKETTTQIALRGRLEDSNYLLNNL